MKVACLLINIGLVNYAFKTWFKKWGFLMLGFWHFNLMPLHLIVQLLVTAFGKLAVTRHYIKPVSLDNDNMQWVSSVNCFMSFRKRWKTGCVHWRVLATTICVKPSPTYNDSWTNSMPWHGSRNRITQQQIVVQELFLITARWLLEQAELIPLTRTLTQHRKFFHQPPIS